MIAARDKVRKTSDITCNCKHKKKKKIAEVASTFALIQPTVTDAFNKFIYVRTS